VGLLDALLGRSKPAAANLDHLFGLPGARITLDAAESLMPTGQAGICFKPAVGQAFDKTATEFEDLLSLDTSEGSARVSDADEYGYRWVVVTGTDFDALVTRVHLVNATLKDHGYDSQLLCSAFGFAPKETPPPPATTYLVYLYKRGTFYPFVPSGPERRDNEAELRISAAVTEDLAIEKDLDQWFPIWGLPVH